MFFFFREKKDDNLFRSTVSFYVLWQLSVTPPEAILQQNKWLRRRVISVKHKSYGCFAGSLLSVIQWSISWFRLFFPWNAAAENSPRHVGWRQARERAQKDAASFCCALAHRIVLPNHKYVWKKNQDCIRITGQILYRCQAKQFTFPPNSVWLLWWWCGNLFFFFLFFSFFFPSPAKVSNAFRVQQRKKSFTQSQFEFLHAYLPVALWIFFWYCRCDACVCCRRAQTTDAVTLMCSHVSTQYWPSISALTRQWTVRRETEKSIYVCVYVLTCICIHTHTNIYTVRKLLNAVWETRTVETSLHAW